MPPPSCPAVFSRMVLPERVTSVLPEAETEMPPPCAVALLPERVLPVMETEPS